tara:strand:+ start:3014 stop:3757 length:744 start_codon:yes stop_codon:yes gene_type:complete
MPDVSMRAGMVFKGGGNTSTGSSSSTTTMEVDEAYDHDVEQAMASLRSQYEDGSLGQVAGHSDIQNETYAAASGNAEIGLDAIRSGQQGMTDAMNGTGQFAASNIDGLEQAAIDQAKKEGGLANDAFASAGAMGGSRSAIAAGDRNAQLSNTLAQTKYDQLNKQRENAMWGSDALTGSGQAESATLTNNISNLAALGESQRGVEQEMLDADAKGLEAYITGITSMQDLISTQTTTSSSKETAKKSGK